MTTNRFDDEILSTIIDGEASPETVASVASDPDALQRLTALRAAVDVVATPIPDATPERRSASIAAAMAAATPASPEVTSLSAKRHEREQTKRGLPTGWLVAAAAAVLLFILGTPLIFSSGGDVAEVAADAVTVDARVEVAEEEAAEEEAMEDEEEAMEAEEAMEDEDEAMADDGEALDNSEAAQNSEAAGAAIALDVAVVTSLEQFDELVQTAVVVPELAGDDILAIETLQARATSNVDEVLATNVNPQCLVPSAAVTNSTPYSLIVLDPFAGPAELVIVEFGDDDMTRLLNAETCEVIR